MASLTNNHAKMVDGGRHIGLRTFPGESLSGKTFPGKSWVHALFSSLPFRYQYQCN